MTNDDLLHLLEQADPAPNSDEVDLAVDGQTMLGIAKALSSASAEVAVVTKSSRSVRGTPRVSLVPVSLAASLVAVLVASLALVLALRGDPAASNDPDVQGDVSTDLSTIEQVVPTPAPGDTAPTTPPVDSTEPSADRIADLTKTFERLVEAVNAGDLTAVMSQFDASAESTMVAGDEPDPDSARGGRSEIELRFATLLAEGVWWDDVTCSPAERHQNGPTIDCSLDVLSSVVQAAAPGPFRVRMTVVGERMITELHVAEPVPGATVYRSFLQRWLNEYHPDRTPDPQGNDLLDAQALARHQAGMAPRWAEFLDTYDCVYDEVCTITIERWVAEYDSRCIEPGEMGSDFPSAALRQHMDSVPPPSEMADAVERLLAVDAALGSGQTQPGAAGELGRSRSDLMAEIGIDEGCWP